MCWAFLHYFLKQDLGLMQRLSIQALEALDVVPDGHHFRGRVKTHVESSNQLFFQEVIKLLWNSSTHLHAYPINEKAKSLNQPNYYEIFFNGNVPHTSTKFRRCLCGSSWDNPLKSFFSFKICNMVLFMWNTTFPSAGGTRIFPTSPMRCGLLTLGSWTTLRLPIASRWPICLPLTLILSEMFNN